jgi:TPR repeat protein
VEAAVGAGHLCRMGRGVTARNETRALNYMLFAADRNSPQGLLHAAQLLLLRHEREREREREKEKVREREGERERDPQDSGAASDRATAIEFLQRAVEMGDREAFFVLARELSDGSGAERREGQALLLGAAEKGDVHAMFHWHKSSNVLYIETFT